MAYILGFEFDLFFSYANQAPQKKWGTNVLAATPEIRDTLGRSASQDGPRLLEHEKVDTGKRACEPVSAPLRHRGALNSALFSPDGRLLVTASFDHNAQVWEVDTGQSMGPPLQHRGAVISDGRLVVTASSDGSARVWESDTGNRQ